MCVAHDLSQRLADAITRPNRQGEDPVVIEHDGTPSTGGQGV